MARTLLIIILVVIGGFGIIFAFTYYNTHNNMVTKQETIDGQWANVQSAYQRRSDLIPNLVSTVQGAADFESETIKEVIEARSQATSINLSTDDLTPENLARFQAAQDQLSGALSRLLVTVERYPELKATQNFSQLQSQLEGTENRIKLERDRFNESVRNYNAYIRRFPAAFFAASGGFESRGYFQADEGTDVVPEVNF